MEMGILEVRILDQETQKDVALSQIILDIGLSKIIDPFFQDSNFLTLYPSKAHCNIMNAHQPRYRIKKLLK